MSKLLGGGGKTICLPPNIFMGGGGLPPSHPPPPQDRRLWYIVYVCVVQSACVFVRVLVCVSARNLGACMIMTIMIPSPHSSERIYATTWNTCSNTFTSTIKVFTYTERKNITSSEQHSRKSTQSKLTIFGHRYKALILLFRRTSEKTTTNWRFAVSSEFHKGDLFRKFSYSFISFNGGLCNHRTGFCLLRTPRDFQPGRRAVSVIFEKLPLAISPHFAPFWLEQAFFFIF